MNLIDVYTKKSYTCRKCGVETVYAKVADDSGKVYTTDGEKPNGKFGKESNILSVPVDQKDVSTIHGCAQDRVTASIREAEQVRDGGSAHNFSVEINEQLKAELDVFDKIVSNAYIKLYDIASRGNPNADHLSKHIGTMGLMHDYFTFRLTNKLK